MTFVSRVVSSAISAPGSCAKRAGTRRARAANRLSAGGPPGGGPHKPGNRYCGEYRLGEVRPADDPCLRRPSRVVAAGTYPKSTTTLNARGSLVTRNERGK